MSQILVCPKCKGTLAPLTGYCFICRDYPIKPTDITQTGSIKGDCGEKNNL